MEIFQRILHKAVNIRKEKMKSSISIFAIATLLLVIAGASFDTGYLTILGVSISPSTIETSGMPFQGARVVMLLLHALFTGSVSSLSLWAPTLMLLACLIFSFYWYFISVSSSKRKTPTSKILIFFSSHLSIKKDGPLFKALLLTLSFLTIVLWSLAFVNFGQIAGEKQSGAKNCKVRDLEHSLITFDQECTNLYRTSDNTLIGRGLIIYKNSKRMYFLHKDEFNASSYPLDSIFTENHRPKTKDPADEPKNN